MNISKHFFTTICILVMTLCLANPLNVYGEDGKKEPVASVSLSAYTVTWQPNVTYRSLVLTVTRPDGKVFTRAFKGSDAPYYQPQPIIDGAYTYELKVIPQLPRRIRGKAGGGENPRGKNPQDSFFKEFISKPPQTQTGYFHVRDGAILVPQKGGENLSRTADIVHADDVIIDGSLCVGNDCYNGLAFGFDTIVMMENNLRIFFDDTSTIQNYPRNDWRIVCNDSTDSGGNYFAIQDATEVSNIMVLEAGAPDNSIYVDNYGDVGINTSTPYYELHIVDGDSPCVRLDQDSSYGWSPQKWDLCGNESNFFIRDATHASKLPFRIEPDSPTDSVFIKSNGYVGIGTGSPGWPLEVETTGVDAAIVAERTSGARGYFSSGLSYFYAGSVTSHPVRIVTGGSWKMQINTDGSIDMSDGGSYDGSWNDASSREVKENIADLDTSAAIEALEKLNPVTFNYKLRKKEKRAGFIAEEVPDLVASNTRKNLSAMDIVAVLTKVLKEQRALNNQQQKTISSLKKKVEKLEKKIGNSD